MINTYFDNIDSDAKAYIVGFFLGDGHLASIEHHDYGIVFAQNTDNRCVLDFIKDEIQAESEVKEVNCPSGYKDNTKMCYLRITDKTLHKSLSELTNCTNIKTFEDYRLPNIPEEFIPGLIRGYFDSDGCISVTGRIDRTRKRKDGSIYEKKVMDCKWYICGKNKYILLDIQEWFNKHDIHVKLKYDSKKDFYYLQTCTKQEICKIYDLLYTNKSFALSRKEQKYALVKLTPSKFWELKNSELCNA